MKMTLKDLTERTAILAQRMDNIAQLFERARYDERIAVLEERAQEEDFWGDAQSAGKVLQELEMRKKMRAQQEAINGRISDLMAMLSDAQEEDGALYEEEYYALLNGVDAQEKQVLLSEPYDAHDAIVTIYAGAGGIDAQDWAQMLLRMYTRWAQERGFSMRIINEARGTEAGYKSVTCEVRGEMMYGLLRMEMGTHRLVRLSPFNADNLRQTSFARVEVLPVLEDAAECTIDPHDLRIDTYRSQGAGGQSVNTTDSAVRITHKPTGIVVTCQNERSQLRNKEQALRVLRGKLAQKQLEEQSAQRAALRGDNVSAQWGSQIRSYVLHPYKMVKDHRTGEETSHVQDVLDGSIDRFIDAALRWHSHREHGILKETSSQKEKAH